MIVTQNKSYIFKNTILRLSDIKAISVIIWREYQQAIGHREDGTYHSIEFNFNLRYTDEHSIKMDDFNEIFNVFFPKLNKRIKAINIEYNSYNPSQTVKISIIHDYQGEFSVSGNDNNWVNGIYNELKEYIDSVERHPQIFNYPYFLIPQSIILLIIWVVICRFMIKNIPGFSTFDLSVFGLLFGITFSMLFGRVSKAWPELEFQIGNKHMLFEKKRRRLLRNFAILIVLALIISLVGNYIFALFTARAI